MARLVKGLLGVAHHRGNTLSVVGRHLLAALQQGEGQVVQNVDSKVVHDGGGSVGAATQTDTQRRCSAQSLAVGADTQQMKQPPEGGQSKLRQRRVVLKGLSRRSDLNGRQAKVLSEVQSGLISSFFLLPSSFKDRSPSGGTVRVSICFGQ